ncbi:YggT family protein [Hathewaya limosa]|uniref:YggT family protein n=1 Tax=Hathewaya limosa TaxID=1536 RepID=A0ABU0JUT5_HATLI|nr:YggT family protein [Hathewaya limosa]AWZ48238.1 YggT family protein [Clostridiaceae bacterium 14S0207]MDQ0480871.1 YggT family protein [Hathewaya limosa]
MGILIRGIYTLLYIIEVSIIIDALLSWVPMNENKFTFIIREIASPFLYLGRKLQDRILPNSPIDFSPIVGLFTIGIIRMLIRAIF